MTPKQKIKNLFKKSSVTVDSKFDEKTLTAALSTLEKSHKTESTGLQTNPWRIIMNKPITKLATIAAVLLIAGLGITFLDKTTTPAWAIEDTIKALENIHSIKITGSSSDDGETQADFILWARPDENGTESGELRLEVPNQQLIVVVPSWTTYTYHPGPNIVSIAEQKNVTIDPWLGSEFFHKVKKYAENWQISYGIDEQTGKDSIFATCNHPNQSKSWWFQFDADTKLPVSFKQWTNINFHGEPQFYATEIEYNPELPEGIFEFEIPEGAEIVKDSYKFPDYFNDPNCGISAEGLTDEEASLIIVEDYLRALIDGDWEYLAQLRPIRDAKGWEFKYKYNQSWPAEVLNIDQPYQDDNCNIGPVVPCTIKYSDGQVKTIKLIVKFRTIDGTRSCVIAGTFGGIKDFER